MPEEEEKIINNPWLDPKFSEIKPFGTEPGFYVDDIPERLGIQSGQTVVKTILQSGKLIDLEDTPSGYGAAGQFLQTDGSGNTYWGGAGVGTWEKIGSNVHYKGGDVYITKLTEGSVLFIDKASGRIGQDNDNLFWDQTNKVLRIASASTEDPSLCLKTTNTAHEVHYALDESAVADHVDMIGQTASVDTYFHVIAQIGQTAKIGVQQSTYRGELIMGAAGHLTLKNITADLDLVLGIKDGAVNKTITWDADVDKLKHSAGLFDFDDDNLLTTGTLGAGNATLGTIGCGTITVVNGSSINLQEDLTFTGATAQNLIKLASEDGSAIKELGE